MFKTTLIATTCAVLFMSSGAFFAQANATTKTPVVAVATQPSTTPAAVQPASTTGSASFMKTCSTQWKALKAAGTAPAGMKWTDYLKTCSANAASATPAVVAPAKPVATAPAIKTPAVAVPVVATKATTAPATSALSEQSRIKQCGAEWKMAKAANTVPAGQTWPQYWSACDARLKG